jgi:hypothetical protein
MPDSSMQMGAFRSALRTQKERFSEGAIGHIFLPRPYPRPAGGFGRGWARLGSAAIQCATYRMTVRPGVALLPVRVAIRKSD